MLPFEIPIALADESNSFSGHFPAHPYALDEAGYMAIGAPDAGDSWALRLSIEDGNDFQGINRAGFTALLSTTSRFGVQTSVNYLTEDLDGGRDDLFMGDLNAIYRFAQHEDFEFRAGVGFRYMADEDDADFGFNFTYGADFFPVRPLVISAACDVGTLGEAFVVNPRVSIGVILADVELFVGYNHLWVESVDIYGPLVGLRYWF